MIHDVESINNFDVTILTSELRSHLKTNYVPKKLQTVLFYEQFSKFDACNHIHMQFQVILCRAVVNLSAHHNDGVSNTVQLLIESDANPIVFNFITKE